jgi:simple sugar transport system ATP-binding protein
MTALVQMRGISKSFAGIIANDQIDLEVYRGEIHALLGENGAGKTTLMNVLFGLYRPDEGQILLQNRPVMLRSPADAIEFGIGMVHQHFKLVPPFTVTENIILGIRSRPLIDMKAASRQVARVSEQYGLEIDPKARVQDLSVGEQQRVEILNSLCRQVEVLILDEPTAVLTPPEVEHLMVVLREMTEQGKAVIFISHKLDEVLRFTDRVTVLRSGKVAFTTLTHQASKDQLAQKMIGREAAGKPGELKAILPAEAGVEKVQTASQPSPVSQPKIMLETDNLYVNDDRGLPAVRGLSFKVHSGEILGIAGVDGNGQRELAEAIVRLRPLQAGQLFIGGKDAAAWDTRAFINHNTAYIVDDRQRDGLILDFDLNRNATLKLFEREPFSVWGLLDFKVMTRFTRQLMALFDIRAPGPYIQTGALSGGNQQKLILAREFSQNPYLIVANKPTRGLDIGATAFIRQKLLEQRARGAGILLISADLDEIVDLSDRILVLFEGRSMGVLKADTADEKTLGLMMTGTPLDGSSVLGCHPNDNKTSC